MSGVKILIVDDSILLQRMYSMLLRRYCQQGAELIFAANGGAALQALDRNDNLALIILDINMPIMNGMEFLDHCKRQLLLRRIPVVVICTRRPEEDFSRILAAGADSYLEKPFKAEDFHELIGSILEP